MWVTFGMHINQTTTQTKIHGVVFPALVLAELHILLEGLNAIDIKNYTLVSVPTGLVSSSTISVFN